MQVPFKAGLTKITFVVIEHKEHIRIEDNMTNCGRPVHETFMTVTDNSDGITHKCEKCVQILDYVFQVSLQ